MIDDRLFLMKPFFVFIKLASIDDISMDSLSKKALHVAFDQQGCIFLQLVIP